MSAFGGLPGFTTLALQKRANHAGFLLVMFLRNGPEKRRGNIVTMTTCN